MTQFVVNLKVPGDNRYNFAQFFKWVDDCYSVFDGRFIREVKALSSKGNLTIVSQEYRPDLVSFDLYGTVKLWGIILLYNDLTSADQLTNGLVVSYPSLGDLESLYFKLAGIQNGISRG